MVKVKYDDIFIGEVRVGDVFVFDFETIDKKDFDFPIKDKKYKVLKIYDDEEYEDANIVIDDEWYVDKDFIYRYMRRIWSE